MSITASTVRPLQPAKGARTDWLSREEIVSLTPDILLERTKALKPLLTEHAIEAEQLRRPVDAVWNAIRKSGVFYHFVPKCYGGLEFSVDSFIDVMLPLAEGCASTGWVTAFCVEHNWMMAQFPREAQDEVFKEFPYIIAPGVTMPPGQVTPVKGGYRLSGHWKWGTGVMHADWVLAAGHLPDGTAPPTVLFFLLPIEDVEVVDVWHVDGMIGTGSNDIVVKDVFVPEHRVLDMGHMREGRAPGAAVHSHNPVYRMPMLPFLALTAAIPAIGNARAAVEHFRVRLLDRNLFGSTVKQAEKPAAQMRLAMADMKTRTAELLVRDVGRKAVELAAREGLATVDERIALRIQVAYAMDLCREAVRTVCEASGSSGHFLNHPLQRALRDVNVMSSHVVYDLDGAAELRGRAMIGLPPNSPVI